MNINDKLLCKKSNTYFNFTRNKYYSISNINEDSIFVSNNDGIDIEFNIGEEFSTPNIISVGFIFNTTTQKEMRKKKLENLKNLDV